MNIPDNLMYTKEHEWIEIEDNIITVGITNFAQEQLGDIVFVELPDEGEDVVKDQTFGAVESVKSVSDCFSPVSGKVHEVNDTLQDSPEMVNDDCYGEGWMIRIEASNLDEVKEYMNKEEYSKFVSDESE